MSAGLQGAIETAPVTRLHEHRSYDPADFGVPGGREEEWRFTPLRRLRGLHTDSPPPPTATVAVAVDPAPEVKAFSAERSVANAGRTFIPADRVSAQAYASFDEATVITVPAEAETSRPTVVTITGCKDAAAWAELDKRVRHGDLAEWSATVDALRHTVQTKLLTPVSWSPLQEIDFEAVPTSGAAHDLSLFMEDTAWPFAGGLSRYLTKCATLYADQTLANQKKEGTGIIELEAAFQPVWGSHKTNEVVLWQRVVNHKALLWMLANDLPPAATAPGTWMHDALALRDQWQSRLLRSAAWSPLY